MRKNLIWLLSLMVAALTAAGASCSKNADGNSIVADSVDKADTVVMPDTVELLFVGDAMQHQPQFQVARRSDGTYDYSECFTLMEPIISKADYAVVNLETPLNGAPYSGYPCFNAPDAYAKELKKVGFDLFLTANNHSLDRRDNGVRRTVKVLDEIGVDHVGTYASAAQRKSALPLIKEIGGIKVAFLNYTYATNGIKVQGDVVVDYINREQIKKDIAAARTAGAELICACMHWGIEYTLTPVQSQKDLAQFLMDEGVEMIIGNHPHVVEPMEMRFSDRHQHRVLLTYSLGNFISNMSKKDCRGGALVKVKLTRDNGKATVASASCDLFFCQKPGGKNRNYKVIPANSRDEVRADARGLFDAFMSSARGVMRKNVDVPLAQ